MYITYLLLAATILISVKGFNDYSFRDRFMLNPYLITHENAWYRSFTHAFLHGDFMHLAFNMFALLHFCCFGYTGYGKF
ncbi:MAG: rhomboid family intramembrane serine protease [Crocinitomicaceae bacterium]|nr:rhomboid family intramembrane serine protease [Crocinitomicaceae bacterium]